jgi:alpha-tubulin suppressor-like RCC1 family protein
MVHSGGVGYNGVGALGINNSISKSSMVQIGSLSEWSRVSAVWSMLAIKCTGQLQGTGYNPYYAIGDGTNTIRYSPVAVGSSTNWKSVSCGYYHTVAIQDSQF